MHYHPVVDQVIHPAALDPLSIALYAVFFIAVVASAIVRPAYGVAVLIVIQPFAFYRDFEHTTITLPKIALAAVFAALLWRRRFLPAFLHGPSRGIGIALLLVTFTAGLSILQAEFHAPAIREALKWLEYFVLFAVVYAGFEADPDSRFYGGAAAGITFVVALIALSQEIFGAPSGLWFNGHPIPRIAGPLEGPNQLAGYLDVSIPLLFALTSTRRNPWYAAFLGTAACAEVLTFSRAGLVCVGITLALIALVSWRAFAVRRAVAALAVGALGGGAVAGFWAWVAHLGFAHSMGIFRISAAEANYAGGVGTRSQLWHAAFELWKRRPLLGIGAGNFEFEIADTGVRNVRTHANSLYIQSLVEQGIVGFLATVWLVWNSIATFRLPAALRSPLIIGALGASVALAMHQTVDLLIFFPKVGGWWVCVMGLGAGALAYASKSPE